MRSTAMNPEEITIKVTYGIGHSCVGRFDRAALEGLPARALIERVARVPQEPGLASRAAQVVARVLQSERTIDAEVMEPARGEATGRPITLDERVLRSRSDGGRGDADRDELSIRISESYVGG